MSELRWYRVYDVLRSKGVLFWMKEIEEVWTTKQL